MNNYTGIDIDQFREFIIRPAIEYLDMWSVSAEELLLGTAIHESFIGRYIKQLKGPALGVYQIEPHTHKSIWTHYIKYREELVNKFLSIYPNIAEWKEEVNDELLIYDLKYSTMIARIIYYRHKEALPRAGNISGHAAYWKEYYNTELGKGSKFSYMSNWKSSGLKP